MPLEFHIAPGSDTPIYRQIVDQVRRAAATGALREGDQLPSVRALAEQLVVNPNTVARAYGDLVRDGVAESRHGRGLFLAPKRRIFSNEERRRRLRRAAETFLSEVAFLDFESSEIRSVLDETLGQWKRPPHPNKEAS